MSLPSQGETTVNLSKRLFALLVFFPLSALATTAHYYDNQEFSIEKPNFLQNMLQKIMGDPTDPEIVPKALRPYEKNKDLISGHYVLQKPLYANEILILADGPFYATVWRSGTAVRLELQALAALLVDQKFKQAVDDYQVTRLAVYTPLIDGKSKKAYVYQTPGLRLPHQNCQKLQSLIQKSGYPQSGAAFSCEKDVFNYIPAYSHAAPGENEV